MIGFSDELNTFSRFKKLWTLKIVLFSKFENIQRAEVCRKRYVELREWLTNYDWSEMGVM